MDLESLPIRVQLGAIGSMAFNSAHFLFFFPIVLAGYWSLRRNPAFRIGFLLAASYYFYMSWSIAYGLLMLAMTAVDFVVAGRIVATHDPRGKRRWLTLSIASNLGMLFLFKYFNFFADNLSAAAGGLGASWTTVHLDLELPLGISFFTFEALSYTIDVYRGKAQPTRSFWRFALFISFFPRMIAGPIIRASNFLPQIEHDPRWDDREAESGLARILAGLFKKVIIADLLGVTLVDPVFANPSAYSSWTLLIAMYGYALQIYYDFSGYSDVALGAARMLGFTLPFNFNRPYLATSMRDFWRRWHISLSTWLRDYLYIPLGGGRGSAWKTVRNLAIVMLLGGLWHGAAWGFVIWGAAHGLLLGLGRLFHAATGIDADRLEQPPLSRAARVAVTFHLVAACFVLFRAVDFAKASAYLTRLVQVEPGANGVSQVAYVILVVALAIELMPRRWMSMLTESYTRIPAKIQGGLVAASVLLFTALGDTGTPFIYFQF